MASGIQFSQTTLFVLLIAPCLAAGFLVNQTRIPQDKVLVMGSVTDNVIPCTVLASSSSVVWKFRYFLADPDSDLVEICSGTVTTGTCMGPLWDFASLDEAPFDLKLKTVGPPTSGFYQCEVTDGNEKEIYSANIFTTSTLGNNCGSHKLRWEDVIGCNFGFAGDASMVDVKVVDDQTGKQIRSSEIIIYDPPNHSYRYEVTLVNYPVGIHKFTAYFQAFGSDILLSKVEANLDSPFFVNATALPEHTVLYMGDVYRHIIPCGTTSKSASVVWRYKAYDAPADAVPQVICSGNVDSGKCHPPWDQSFIFAGLDEVPFHIKLLVNGPTLGGDYQCEITDQGLSYEAYLYTHSNFQDTTCIVKYIKYEHVIECIFGFGGDASLIDIKIMDNTSGKRVRSSVLRSYDPSSTTFQYEVTLINYPSGFHSFTGVLEFFDKNVKINDVNVYLDSPIYINETSLPENRLLHFGEVRRHIISCGTTSKTASVVWKFKAYDSPEGTGPQVICSGSVASASCHSPWDKVFVFTGLDEVPFHLRLLRDGPELSGYYSCEITDEDTTDLHVAYVFTHTIFVGGTCQGALIGYNYYIRCNFGLAGFPTLIDVKIVDKKTGNRVSKSATVEYNPGSLSYLYTVPLEDYPPGIHSFTSELLFFDTTIPINDDIIVNIDPL